MFCFETKLLSAPSMDFQRLQWVSGREEKFRCCQVVIFILASAVTSNNHDKNRNSQQWNCLKENGDARYFQVLSFVFAVGDNKQRQSTNARFCPFAIFAVKQAIVNSRESNSCDENTMTPNTRVAQSAEAQKRRCTKILVVDENLDPQHTLFCREISFVANYAL